MPARKLFFSEEESGYTFPETPGQPPHLVETTPQLSDTIKEKEMENPYETPSSDPALPGRGGIDTSSPLSPAGRFGRLSYIAWNMVLNIIGYLILLLLGGQALMTEADPEAARQFLETGGAWSPASSR